MKTKKITLENGWNPNFEAGTKVVAIANMWTIKPGDEFVYSGGCDHPEYGWAVQLQNCDLAIPVYLFEGNFKQIV